MLYSVTSLIKITDYIRRDYFYYVESIDVDNLSDLLPNRKIEVYSEEELMSLYMKHKTECSNFVVENNSLVLKEKLQVVNLPSSMLEPIIPPTDDLWNFLFKLSRTDALILTTRSDYKVDDNFRDKEKTYFTKAKNLLYSQKHANCSIHQLIEGTIEGGEDEEAILDAKRWVTIPIIKNNKLKRRTITFICSELALETLRNQTVAHISSLSLNSILEDLGDMKLDIDLDTQTNLMYCTFDLTQLPIVNADSHLVMDTGYILDCVNRLNVVTMVSKALKEIKTQLKVQNPDFFAYDYEEEEDVYKAKYISEDETKYKGVTFHIEGIKSLPSINQALKQIGVTNVASLFDKTETELESLASFTYKLKPCVKSSVDLLLNYIIQYKNYENLGTYMNMLNMIISTYNVQRELFKLRLNYIRSMFVANFPDEVFEGGQFFQFKLNNDILTITFDKF